MLYIIRTTRFLIAIVFIFSLSSKAFSEASLKHDINKKSLNSAQRKIDTRLLRLKEDIKPERLKALGLKTPDQLTDHFQKIDKNGAVQLYIYYTGNKDLIAGEIKNAGGRVERAPQKIPVIQAWVPYGRIEDIAGLSDVRRVGLPDYAFTRMGSVTTEGDVVLNADKVRARGLTGVGKKVGVISDGINGIALSQATNDIPPTYDAESTRSIDHNLYAGGEGTAMMEIVYDIAPGAALAFSNPYTSLDMVESIQLLDTKYNCDVIVDDLGFFGESWFEDDAIAQAAKAATANGKLYVSACGNSASGDYYQCTFEGTAKTIGGISMTVETYSAGDCFSTLSVPANTTAYVFLQWNDQFGSSANDYDLYLTNPSGTVIYASSEGDQSVTHDPIEGLLINNPSGSTATYEVVVNKYSGATRYLKLVSYRGTMQYWTATGSIWGHPACTDVVATGAINHTTPSNIETFSSQGPVRMDFPSPEYRQKPDLCGIDGVSVTGNGWTINHFYGTSAAAPHIAAIAALAWSLDTTQTNEAVRNKIQDNCVDLGGAGVDNVYGHGRADIYKALVTSDTTPPPAPAVNTVPATSSSSSLLLSGTKSSDTYRLRINGSIEGVTFTSPVSWESARTLVKGTNRFTVVARDFASNESTPVTVETFYSTPPAAPSVDAVPAVVLSSTLKLTGTMTSETNLLLINGTSEGVTLLSPVSWESTRTLARGLNRFTVKAKNIYGSESTPVTVETAYSVAPSAPTVDAVAAVVFSSTLKLTGTMTSETNLLLINGTSEGVTLLSPVSWESTRTLTPGLNRFTVKARNIYGTDSTPVTAETIYSAPPAAPSVDAVPAVVLSSTLKLTGTMTSETNLLLINGTSEGVTLLSSVSWESTRTLARGLNRFTIKARNIYGSESTPVTVETAYSVAPSAPTIDAVAAVVFSSSLKLTGTMTSETNLLLINGTSEGVTLLSPVSWESTRTLAPGLNRFTVKARNVYGTDSTPVTAETIYSTPPAAPSVDAVPAVVLSSTLKLTGTMTSETNLLLINGTSEGVTLLSSVSWESTRTLARGLNRFTIKAKNIYGSESTPVTVETAYSVAPAAPTIDAVPAVVFSSSLKLTGTMTSETNLLLINGTSEGVTLLSPVSWESTRTLAPGLNRFTVKARNVYGTDSSPVTAETIYSASLASPTVNTIPATVVSSTLKLSGSMSSDIYSLLINGTSEGVTLLSSVSWESIRTLAIGNNRFTVVARNLAGNESAPVTVEVMLSDISYSDPANGVSIVFPVGCSATVPVVTVETYSDPGSLGGYPAGMILLGSGLNISCSVTSFLVPVTVTMPLPSSSLNAMPYYWDAASNSWSNSGLTLVSRTSTSITFTTTHFTIFAVLGISGNISDIAVYPNPFRIGSSTGVVFDFLRGDEKINIYTVSGELVMTAQVPSGTFRWVWDCRNASGNMVGEDIYIYLVRNSLGQKRTGKLAVLR